MTLAEAMAYALLATSIGGVVTIIIYLFTPLLDRWR